MKKLICIVVLFILFLFNIIYAQHNFNTIKADYVKGNLSYQQYLEYSALNIFEPDKVPQQYRLTGGSLPLKSGTFLIQEVKIHWDELSADAREILAKYLYRPQLPFSVLSPSNRFRIHYTTSGTNKVDPKDNNKNGIPDYVELAGQYFDYAHFLIVDSLGYQAPAADSSGLGKEFDVYLVQLNKCYGVTLLEQLIPGTKSDAHSCYIEIENDFQGFQTPPLQSLRVTSAHEYYHAVQVSYAFRDEDIFYMEMCSTWMEDFAHDDVNDYLLYLSSFFTRIDYPFSYADGSYEYGACIWNHLIVKKYDTNLIRQIWENTPNVNVMTSIHEVLSQYGTSFNEELASFGLWNYFTGSRSDISNYYPEGNLYPEVRFVQEYNVNGNDLNVDGQMCKLSSIFYQVNDAAYNLSIGLIITNFETPEKMPLSEKYNPSDKADFNINLATFTSARPSDKPDFFIKNNLVRLSDHHGIRLNIDHKENWFAQAVVTDVSGQYEVIQFFPMYSTNNHDENNFIENIYPNPLIIGKNEPLTITYYFSKSGELDIYSSDGRLIRKHNLNTVSRYYDWFEWDGRDENGALVSSGIYVVLLRTGSFVDTKKLAIIR